LPGHWQTRLTGSYVHPEGFSPLQLDLTSPAASLNFEAVRLVADKMRVDFTCGRDIQNGYYQDAVLRGEFMLSKRDRIEMQSGYSIQLSQLRPLDLRWIFATQRTWWSALTLNYNLDQTSLTDISLDMDWTPSPKWRVQFLSGFSDDFTTLNQADIRITRDLHCMLAQLTYSNSTHMIMFGLGIKAFPSNSQTFGIGSQGQYFESNYGDSY